MTKHTTSRGIPFDMDSIRMQNEHVIAAGNTSMNARGDIVGSGGRVIKKAEELAREQYTNQQTQISNTAKLKQPIEETIADLDIAKPAAKTETKKKGKTITEPVEEATEVAAPTLTKEVVLANGDIVVVDDEQDPTGGVE